MVTFHCSIPALSHLLTLYYFIGMQRLRNQSSSMPNSRASGLVLSEIVVSIGLLAIVGLSIVGVFSYLAVSSHTNADRAAASLLADSVLEKAVKEGPDDWGVGSGNLFTELETSDAVSTTRFTYQVQAQKLKEASLGDTYQVTVDVAWSAPDEGGRVERGKGHIQRTRTIYVETSGLIR